MIPHFSLRAHRGLVGDPLAAGERDRGGETAPPRLRLCCAIARAHGGVIRLESSDANGTTFTAELPSAI